MHVRVLPLRREGARLDYPLHHRERIEPAAFVGGTMEFGMPIQREVKGQCLLVRHPEAAPGCNVFEVLYDPKITSVEHEYFIVRGFEPVEDNEATVGFLQEWAVFVR